MRTASGGQPASPGRPGAVPAAPDKGPVELVLAGEFLDVLRMEGAGSGDRVAATITRPEYQGLFGALRAFAGAPQTAPSVRLNDGLDQRQGVSTSAGSQPDFQPSTGVPAGDIEDSMSFALAKAAGANVVQHEFEEDGDISGMLYRDATRTVIGVNATHSLTRRRFTIAHELGHLRLHPGRPLILDAPARVNFRDRTASLATDREEIEANAFAAALLMPERLVLASVERVLGTEQHTPERLVRLLADDFQVSEAAMGYRLINLGITT